MKIERFCYSHEGTFGKIQIGGKTFYTCEPPWENNLEFASCIPEGKYGLKRDRHGEYQFFTLTNLPSNRMGIEFHVGNNKDDTEGCILVGKSLGYVRGHWAVINSKAAMREFYNLVRDGKVTTLHVTSIFGESNERKKAEL